MENTLQMDFTKILVEVELNNEAGNSWRFAVIDSQVDTIAREVSFFFFSKE